MIVLFLHGWESTPGGVKPRYFEEHGHTVLNPALPPDDFEASLRVAQEAYDQGRPDLVVGSSRGGAVALNIEAKDTPLLLLCPAWKKWGATTSARAGTVIMHSREDEIVPFVMSQELYDASPRGVRLVEAGSDHRLSDPVALARILELALEAVGGPAEQ